MQRSIFIAVGVGIITLVAAGLTEATLARGDRGVITDPHGSAMAPSTTPRLTASPTPTPLSAPAPTATPRVMYSQPTTALTTAPVNVRGSASTTAPIIAGFKAATTVTLGPISDATWQEVVIGASTGYITKAYLEYPTQ